MATQRIRFDRCPDGSQVLDRETGLIWESHPPDLPLAWIEAVAAAQAEGARLPTIAELMELVTSLGDGQPFVGLRAGIVFWSSSESPFAPATKVRVVAADPGLRFAVSLRDKDSKAWLWQVREGAR